MTLRLILMRHAKSSWDDDALSDHARPLNARGQASARALGDWLRARGYLPDQVLCSTATRTRETLAGLDLSAPVEFLDQLYHASTAIILDTLHAHATGNTVLLITHNPGCADFADRFVTAPPAHARFHDYPTGATLVATPKATAWNRVEFRSATVVDFITPRDLID